MKAHFCISCFFYGLFLAIILPQKIKAQENKEKFRVKIDSITFLDKSRNRPVPVAFYLPLEQKKIKKRKVVIFSHGYYQNAPGGNKKASYLTEALAAQGYFVASVQHELVTDSLIPSAGIPQIVRRPFWDRGADNIMFVINELKTSYPELDFKNIILIGLSNGGDITALFPQKYPGRVSRIITLDNRRMALPRTKNPKVYTLRSSDQPSDDGVLPTPEEQKRLNITVIRLPATIHNDMDNRGTPKQQAEIVKYISSFLND